LEDAKEAEGKLPSDADSLQAHSELQQKLQKAIVAIDKISKVQLKLKGTPADSELDSEPQTQETSITSVKEPFSTSSSQTANHGLKTAASRSTEGCQEWKRCSRIFQQMECCCDQLHQRFRRQSGVRGGF
jgi:hypothetical protein